MSRPCLEDRETSDDEIDVLSIFDIGRVVRSMVHDCLVFLDRFGVFFSSVTFRVTGLPRPPLVETDEYRDTLGLEPLYLTLQD